MYRRLLSNTVLFSVSTFGSKILLFLLTPFYTSILTDAEYGVTDLIIQTGNVLIPLVSMGIINAVLRFGLDETTDLKGLFTTGLVVILVGEGVLALCYPLLQSIGLLSDYVLLLLLYVLMANLHAVFGAMAQAMGKVRLYAGSGILCTALVVALVLFGALGLWRYFQPAAVGRGLVKQMFRYCLPLIPATVCSWIINISDRYFISFLIGPDVSGLYAVGNKVASILLILSGIFTSAWQLSIVSERSKAEQERFFSNVFSVYEAGALVGASLLMASSRLVMRFLAAPDYFSAWHYAPVLILGTAMACLGSFFASVYVAEKRSSATLVTTLAGAGVNLAGNALLIPLYGAMGAAVATLLSYLVILIARAVHSRSLLRVAWKVPRFVLAMGILLLQCVLVEWENTALALVCCLGILALYFRPLWRAWKTGIFTRR